MEKAQIGSVEYDVPVKIEISVVLGTGVGDLLNRFDDGTPEQREYFKRRMKEYDITVSRRMNSSLVVELEWDPLHETVSDVVEHFIESYKEIVAEMKAAEAEAAATT